MARPFYDEGLHVGEILKQEFTQAKTGTTQFYLRVKIMGAPTTPPVEGDYDAYDKQYERSIYMALTEKTAPWIAPKLERLGFVGNRVSELDPSSPHHQSFVGHLVDLWCGHKDDNKGGWREEWQISTGPQAKESVQIAPKALRNLDALFGKALKASAKPAQQQAATGFDGRSTTQYTDQGITDDDIPF